MTTQDGSALRERLAAIEHEQWEKWSREVAEQGLTPERIERWGRYWVPYEQLDEATKDHDRVWADKVLAALPPSAPPGQAVDPGITTPNPDPEDVR